LLIADTRQDIIARALLAGMPSITICIHTARQHVLPELAAAMSLAADASFAARYAAEGMHVKAVHLEYNVFVWAHHATGSA
jgi:hypothetical protein